MEGYFNEMLEFQEAVKSSFKQGYKSDWPKQEVVEEAEPVAASVNEEEVPAPKTTKSK